MHRWSAAQTRAVALREAGRVPCLLSCLLSMCHSNPTAWTLSFDRSHSRFAVKNPFLLPLTQPWLPRRGFFEGGAELLLETGLRSTWIFFFFAVPTFILNALPARGKAFWGALVDKNVQWGRHQCRDLDTLGCQPGGHVWLWALFSLCSESRNESKSC